MLSAFSVERCPPSRWNTVRHQHGIVSAIAWNTQLAAELPLQANFLAFAIPGAVATVAMIIFALRQQARRTHEPKLVTSAA